jgi:mannosyltransferase OCH1-like enzyme
MMLGMREAQELIKGNNPEFRHHVFDDVDCLEFMRTNFDAKVLEAYESLIPTAYKADLWRYCILYVCGGIYLDIKFRPCDGFKFMELVNDEYFVLDRADLVGRPCVYNALIVAKAGNEYLKKCIDKSVYNILNRNYGVCALDITGPTMMASCFPYWYYWSLGYLRFDGNETDNYYIITGDEPERKLLEFYREYRDEQRMTEKVERYHSLWNKGAVFTPIRKPTVSQTLPFRMFFF